MSQLSKYHDSGKVKETPASLCRLTFITFFHCKPVTLTAFKSSSKPIIVISQLSLQHKNMAQFILSVFFRGYQISKKE